MPNTPDARPIAWGELTETQREGLKTLATRLRDMADDAASAARPGAPPRRPGPWAVVDVERTHRTLMLSGPRGTGKTSVLLTLLQQCVSRQGGEIAANLGDLGGVRVLPPVDFEPLPPNVPLVEWLVGALRPLAEWLDQGCDGQLLKRWRQTLRAASVGWGFDGHAHRDLTENVLDREDQLTRWAAFPAEWEALVDQLTEAVAKHDRVEQPPLLVIPIDDCDLQIDRVHEVFHAVRLLQHRRLVFLLTGDIEHARDMERLRAWREMFGADDRTGVGALTAADDAVNVLERPAEQWVRELAQARLDKAVASGNRVHLPLMSLVETLDWRGGWMANRLHDVAWRAEWRGALTTPDKADAFVREWPGASELREVRIRALAQLHAAHESERKAKRETRQDASSDDPIRDLLALVAAPSLNGTAITARGRADRVTRHPTGRGPLVVTSESSLYGRVSGGATPRRLPASLTIRLRFDLEHHRDEHQRPQDAPSEGFYAGPLLVWSLWTNESVGGIFWWPLPLWPRSPWETGRLYRLWADHRPPANSTIDEIAFRFVRMCVELCEGSLAEGSPPTAPGLEDWRRLLSDLWEQEAVAEGGPRGALFALAFQHIPLLAAPEYGLGVEVREVILLGTRERVEKDARSLDLWRGMIAHDRSEAQRIALEQYRELGDLALPEGERDTRVLPSVAEDAGVGDLQRSIPTDPLWRAIIEDHFWLSSNSEAADRLLGVFRGHIGPGGRLPELLDEGAGPWLVQSLNRLLLLGRPSRWGKEWARVRSAAAVSPSDFVTVLWDALLAASRGWDATPETQALSGLIRLVTDGTPWQGVTTLEARPVPPDEPIEYTTTRGGGFSEVPASDLPSGLPWEIPALTDKVDHRRLEGITAMVLLCQSVLADKDAAPRTVLLANPELRGAEGFSVASPELASWFDRDLLLRDLALQRAVAGTLPERDPNGRRRWAAAAVLQAVAHRSMHHGHGVGINRWQRTAPSVLPFEPNVAYLQGELPGKLSTAIGFSPPFSAWWRENRDLFVRELGDIAASTLPHAPDPGTPTPDSAAPAPAEPPPPAPPPAKPPAKARSRSKSTP